MDENKPVRIALFKEDQLDQTAEAVSRLRDMGIPDRDMTVISSVPFSDRILGRPMSWTHVPQIAIAGAVVGFLLATALNLTPLLYPLHVGGMPLIPIPTSIVVTFELTMLGLLLSTFLGVAVETLSPSYGPRGYSPNVTNGEIGILYYCPTDLEKNAHSSLMDLGAKDENRLEVDQK
jgi:hypothetical protein